MIKLHELLEVEENEEFRTKESVYRYRISNSNLEMFSEDKNCWAKAYLGINELKNFKSKIIRKPKFPKNKTNYYYIAIGGYVTLTTFERIHSGDILNFRLGNFYLTKEEAEANKEKWINFYKNPTQIKWEE